MTAIRVRGLSKSFGSTTAVDDVSFDVESGTLVSLLGPSGCGKTTTLRLIAGLEHASTGEIVVGDRLLTSASRQVSVPPHKRRMGMVFQSYAIWPHMTVFENVAFPLRTMRLPQAEIRDKVMAMLSSLGLEGFHDRPGPMLSGGQQQRVALGRALIADPDVLLLDEPFSNLDARRREEMRFEVKELQARIGVTTVFITHDQSEAMILSDRIFVMNTGSIVQEGSPREIYEEPHSRFVMDFLGQVDCIPARVTQSGGQYVAKLNGIGSPEVPLQSVQDWRDGDEVELMLRSSAVRICAARTPGAWHGVVQSTIYFGLGIEYVVDLGGVSVRAFGTAADPFAEGSTVGLSIPPDAIKAWPANRVAD